MPEKHPKYPYIAKLLEERNISELRQRK